MIKLNKAIFKKFIFSLKNYNLTVLLIYLIQKSKYHRIQFGEELLLNINTIQNDLQIDLPVIKNNLIKLTHYKCITYTFK